MNLLDRMIAGVSPGWAVRRLGARAMLSHYQRDYASARHGRRNKGWTGRETSANVEIASSMRTLRARAHEFARDHWAGRRILNVLTSHVVGTGIQSMVDTGSDRKNRVVNDILQTWFTRPDAEDVLSWGGLQALAVRGMAEGGETVLRFIRQEIDPVAGGLPLRLLGLEGEQIDSSRDRLLADNNARMGVGLGEAGRRTGLWLFEEHPGDMAYGGTQSAFVPRDQLCHLYRPERFGQIRGISWFAPILLDAKELMDLREAVVAQERTRACFAGFIHRAPGSVNPLASSKDGETGQKVTRIEPGMIADIGESEISFATPSGSSTFAEVNRSGLLALAAGADITYDQLTGDLTGANYSSLRAGKIEFRRLVAQIQRLWVIPMLIDPVIRKAVETGNLAGLFRLGKTCFSVDHILPAVEPIDPKKDLEADILAVRSGRMSPQEFIMAWGQPWQKVVEDTSAFLQFLDNLPSRVALDIDGRKPRHGGAGDSKKD